MKLLYTLRTITWRSHPASEQHQRSEIPLHPKDHHMTLTSCFGTASAFRNSSTPQGPSHDAYILLPQLLYTLTTSEFNDNQQLLEFDQRHRQWLTDVINITMNGNRWSQATPVKDGGLGIPSVPCWHRLPSGRRLRERCIFSTVSYLEDYTVEWAVSKSDP